MPQPTPSMPACFSFFFTSCPQARRSIDEPIEDVSPIADAVSKSTSTSTSPQLLDANKLAELAAAALAPGPMPSAYAKMNRELKDVHRTRLRTKTDPPEILRPEDTEKTDKPEIKKTDKPEIKKTDKPVIKKTVKPKKKNSDKSHDATNAEFDTLPMIEAR